MYKCSFFNLMLKLCTSKVKKIKEKMLEQVSHVFHEKKISKLINKKKEINK